MTNVFAVGSRPKSLPVLFRNLSQPSAMGMHKRILLPSCGYFGYTSPMTGKDAGFRIRVERDLRDKFIEMCRAKDRPAAQVVRDFMRQYIEDNAAANDIAASKKKKGHS